MSSTLTPDWIDRDLLAEAFREMPTPHGATFDDGRRWCGRCETPVLTCAPVMGNGWADKICQRCTSIWPEFSDLYQLQLLMADEDEDYFPETMH